MGLPAGPTKTYAMIKPDACAAGKANEICQIIELNGFVILQKKHLQLNRARAQEFYAEHRGKNFFDELVSFMSSGPIVALALSKESAVADWRNLMGPTDTLLAVKQAPQSIRAMFGTDKTQNACHGSDSEASAARELKFFFPNIVLDPLPSADAARKYIADRLQPTLIKGLTSLCKEKPSASKLEAITWLANWLSENNPDKPHVFEEGDFVLSAENEDDDMMVCAPAGDDQDALDAMEEEIAATRLQAHFRGFQARKGLKGNTGSASANTVVIESHTDDAKELEEAATKVQAHFKGHQSRKMVKQKKASAAAQ